MNVDLHNHVITKNFLDAVQANKVPLGVRIEGAGETMRLVHDQGYGYPIARELYDVEAKIEGLNRRRIDVAALSAMPTMFYYWADVDMACAAAKLVNDGIAAMVEAHPDRLRGMGTVPLQHPEAAIAELERVVREYGFKAIEIGTSVDGKQVADPKFRDFLRRAEELNVFLFAHPLWLDPCCGLGDYYFINLIGNPLDTTIMASRLMLSGAMDELKKLRICLAHGGGYLPYQVGRLAHGHAVRPETHAATKTSPLEHLKRFYFDALLHHPQAIRYLIDLVGADHVVLGTDAPFDMGEENPLPMLDRVPNLTKHERHQVCCGTALSLLGEKEPARKTAQRS